MRQLVAAGNTPIRGLQTSGCDDSPPGFYDTFGEEDTGNNLHDLQLDFKGTEQPLKHSEDRRLWQLWQFPLPVHKVPYTIIKKTTISLHSKQVFLHLKPLMVKWPFLAVS